MKKLFPVLAASCALAAPAHADRLSPLEIFVANRASTVCIVTMGLSSLDEAIRAEMKKMQQMGLSQSQYANFNESSGDDEWVGDQVDKLIEEMGGCQKVYDEVLQETRNKRSTYQL